VDDCAFDVDRARGTASGLAWEYRFFLSRHIDALWRDSCGVAPGWSSVLSGQPIAVVGASSTASSYLPMLKAPL
jgi:hypothetical protein